MKKIFFLLLLLPAIAYSQNGEEGLFSMDWKDDSTVQRVSLPLTKLNLSGRADFGRYARYSYVIRHDSLYYRIFENYSRDSLPVFDFTKQELILRSACTQCTVSCPTTRPCHRNACRWSSSWLVRDKKRLAVGSK